MRSFNMGGFGTGEPWFRVGNVDVNTTMAVVGAGVLSMFVWAVEGPGRGISKYLWLQNDDVFKGQIWRLLTWPIPNAPDFWTIILFAVFFMLGSQLEASMGRRHFTSYLLVMTIIPAIVVSIFALVTGLQGGVAGLRDLELGVLVGFAVRYPTARFWPGIPAWGIASVFIVLQLLQALGNGDGYSIVMLLTIVGVSLVAIRSLGYAEDSHWIPRIALPAVATGQSKPSRGGSAPKTTSKGKRRRGRAKLTAVPPAAVVGPPRKELTKLEEAELDGILEQVSEQGLKSLTDEQRQRLESHSKRLRRRGD